MFIRKSVLGLLIGRCYQFNDIYKISIRTIQAGSSVLFKENDANNKALVRRDSFATVKNKDKQTYLDMVKIFEGRDKHRRGHVEFIHTALKHMDDFGVNKDLEVYKSLINVLPKGKFIPQNIFQSEFMHYPKQQQIAIDVLEQMEDNGVIPDTELEDILLNIFGNRGHPVRKYMRMMYWMPKFKNISPWPIPNPVPNDALELAKIAIARMSSVDLQSELTVYETRNVKDSIDDTWIVSAQSPKQKEILAKRPITSAVFVEGAFTLWLRDAAVSYFILRAEPAVFAPPEEDDPDDVSKLRIPMYEKPKQVIEVPSVHEQDDGIILGMCATGTSSQDSLLSWVRSLEKDGNPALGNVPVVFTLRQRGKEMVVLELNESSSQKPPAPVDK